MKFRIKSCTNGTYYQGDSPIGPMFGAGRDEAETFTDGWAAHRVMKGFPLIVDADLVNENDEPCDVNGKPLRDPQ